MRRDWGLSDKFVVGYSGNLGRAHEFQTIIGAMERLRAEPRIAFVFIRGGVGMSALKAHVAAAGLPNAWFFPYQPNGQLSEGLSVPDVHLVSLRPELEGLVVPSKIYGIVAAGRPAVFIGDPAGQVAQLISACRCGFSVRVGDIGGLVVCLRTLEGSTDMVSAMGRRGRSCFDRHYDITHGVRRWRSVLEESCGLEA